MSNIKSTRLTHNNAGKPVQPDAAPVIADEATLLAVYLRNPTDETFAAWLSAWQAREWRQIGATR